MLGVQYAFHTVAPVVGLGGLAVALHQVPSAVRIFGAVHQLLGGMPFGAEPGMPAGSQPNATIYERFLLKARRQLGESAFQTAWALRDVRWS